MPRVVNQPVTFALLVEWLGWLALFLPLPAVVVVSSPWMAASATQQPVSLVMDLHSKQKFVLVNESAVWGYAKHTFLYIAPFLYLLNALAAVFGPFHAVRAKLGDLWTHLIPAGAVIVTSALCWLEQYSLTHHSL